MQSSNESSDTSNLILTREEAREGLTLRLKRGTVVRIKDWVNKNGSDVLFVVKVSGVYKIHGEIKENQ